MSPSQQRAHDEYMTIRPKLESVFFALKKMETVRNIEQLISVFNQLGGAGAGLLAKVLADLDSDHKEKMERSYP